MLLHLSHIIAFFFLVVPGAFIVSRYFDDGEFDASSLSIIILGLTSAVSYGVFWAYFLNEVLGKAVSIAVMIGCISVVVSSVNRTHLAKTLSKFDVWCPLLIMLLVGFLYLSMLLVGGGDGSPIEIAQRRFTMNLPMDNELPRRIIETLYDGNDPRESFAAHWLTSDRPPLQSAIVLLQRPFHISSSLLQYQIISTLAQCMWIPAVWALCRFLGLDFARIRMVLLFLVPTGFFLVNSVYVWPKLLSGSLIIGSIVLIFGSGRTPGSPVSSKRVVLAGTMASLGLLGHGGVIFSLLGTAPFLLCASYRLPWRKAILGVCTLTIFLTPWILYQKLYDPPGNRLIRMHLAGVQEIDGRTAFEAISDVYSEATLEDILARKRSSVSNLLGHPRSIINMSTDGVAVSTRQSTQFYHFFPSFGFLNIGYLAGLVLLVVPNESWASEVLKGRFLLLSGIVALTLFLWIAMMFGSTVRPVTITHQGSYANMMILFALLATAISVLPRKIPYALLAIHVYSFLITWPI